MYKIITVVDGIKASWHYNNSIRGADLWSRTSALALLDGQDQEWCHVRSSTLWQERRVLSSPLLNNPVKSCPWFYWSFLLQNIPFLPVFLINFILILNRPHAGHWLSLSQLQSQLQFAKSLTVIDHDIKIQGFMLYPGIRNSIINISFYLRLWFHTISHDYYLCSRT